MVLHYNTALLFPASRREEHRYDGCVEHCLHVLAGKRGTLEVLVSLHPPAKFLGLFLRDELPLLTELRADNGVLFQVTFRPAQDGVRARRALLYLRQPFGRYILKAGPEYRPKGQRL